MIFLVSLKKSITAGKVTFPPAFFLVALFTELYTKILHFYTQGTFHSFLI